MLYSTVDIFDTVHAEILNSKFMYVPDNEHQLTLLITALILIQNVYSFMLI